MSIHDTRPFVRFSIAILLSDLAIYMTCSRYLLVVPVPLFALLWCTVCYFVAKILTATKFVPFFLSFFLCAFAVAPQPITPAQPPPSLSPIDSMHYSRQWKMNVQIGLSLLLLITSIALSQNDNDSDKSIKDHEHERTPRKHHRFYYLQPSKHHAHAEMIDWGVNRSTSLHCKSP